jgi:hypothetical protein
MTTIIVPRPGYLWAVGLTSDNLTYVLEPRWNFSPAFKELPLMSGGKRKFGYASATWVYGFLSDLDRAVFRALCPDPAASAKVYVQTKILEGSNQFKLFYGDMYWPPIEDPQNKTRMDFRLEFKYLTEVTP